MTDEDVESLWLEIPEPDRAAKMLDWADLPPDEIERRKKLSVIARQRHREVDPETGRPRFGGAQPGSGRPKKKRVAKMIAERAQEKESKRIMDALFKKLDSDDDRVSLRAVEAIARIEAKEEELQQKEQELDDKPKDQLIAGLAEVLTRLDKAGELDALGLKKPDFVDGTAEEVTIPGDGDGGTAGGREQEVS